MKYKVGDRVKIKSLDWYNNNKNKFGKVWTKGLDGESQICFDSYMKPYCGMEDVIFSVKQENYILKNNSCAWTDDMIEGLVEEDKPKFKVGDKITNGKEDFTISHIARNKYIVEDNLGEYDTLYFDTQNDWSLLRERVITTNEPLFETSDIPLEKEMEWNLPNGYQFVDENGNVINATKIVLEKKKKEYPKTYEECAKELGYNQVMPKDHILGYMGTLLSTFQQLLICRDAYWKIAGEEMGLRKSWEPDWENSEEKRYCIVNIEGSINLPEKTLTKWILKVTNKILVFPTEEMRDAFYENFKELIENCKELL